MPKHQALRLKPYANIEFQKKKKILPREATERGLSDIQVPMQSRPVVEVDQEAVIPVVNDLGEEFMGDELEGLVYETTDNIQKQ